MNGIDHLWKERFASYLKELRRYSRYIFNDHLLFVLIFGLGAAAFYYSRWVRHLEPDFPAALVMGVVLGLVLAASPVHTLLKEADQVFLIPMEMRMRPFFRKAILFSFSIQAYVLLFALAALMPMYAKVTGRGFGSFFGLLVMLFVLKIWNLLLVWYVLKLTDASVPVWDWIVRFACSAAFVFLVVKCAPVWLVGILAAVMIVLFAYFYRLAKNRTLRWDVLIEREQRRMMGFYRFANLFTDVPELKAQVKRCKWLDPLLGGIHYGQEHAYQYLFARTFLRTSQYFGLYVRLTTIGAVLLFFSHERLLALSLAVVFIYLTAFQMIPMIGYHDLKIWLQLYPVHTRLKKASFLRLLSVCLYVQTVVFAAASALNGLWMNGLLVLAAGAVFTWLLIVWYVPGKIRKT
ncbi:ABC transporter permease [Weizmannia acidilactici]|uniref:ABC transporter permease n=1 Tax=Weizmannia acidilactici TaxID=2607726 RepID=A0A5J4JL86_9BACI|nr:ABC transporter permease [Weizmannia acidilactici]GER65801.1 ABC transporter permease [Weizmannia acidilactici]GER71137.1 ABC transporter permease [Weizmannia acidilactici]